MARRSKKISAQSRDLFNKWEKPNFSFAKNFYKTNENLIYIYLTRRLSGFEILNNTTLIFQNWLVSKIFANICHYLNFPEEY